VHLRNYLWILPSTAYNFMIFPFWHRTRYGPEALMAKMLYGWAHVFAVWDIERRVDRRYRAAHGPVRPGELSVPLVHGNGVRDGHHHGRQIPRRC